jgi:hypothetical protein
LTPDDTLVFGAADMAKGSLYVSLCMLVVCIFTLEEINGVGIV